MIIALKKIICDMIFIKILIWFTNLFQSYGMTMFNNYYKSHKVFKSFQQIFEYIFIFEYVAM